MSPDDVETSCYRALLSNGMERAFKHPLFQLFSKLKWEQLKSMMMMCIFWALLYYCFLIIYVLSQESHHLKGTFNEAVLHGILVFFFIGELLDQGMGVISYIAELVRSAASKENINSSDKFMLGMERAISFSAPILLGYYLFPPDMEGTSRRDIGTVLVALSTYNLLNMISQIPRIGIQKLMMARVLSSIMQFFMAFMPVLMAFAVIFHVLLPHVEVFQNIDTALIKVSTMLMGEFDFTDNFVSNEDSTPLVKFFFFTSMVFMSLVMMNLVLGMAVADVSELEQVSKVKSAVLEYYILSLLEGMLLTTRRFIKLNSVVPNPSVLKDSDNTPNIVYLDLVDLERNSNNRIYVSNVVRGVISSFECPQELLMSIIDILKERKEDDDKSREEALEEEKKDKMFQMLETLVKKQEGLEENISSMERMMAELGAANGRRGSAIN